MRGLHSLFAFTPGTGIEGHSSEDPIGAGPRTLTAAEGVRVRCEMMYDQVLSKPNRRRSGIDALFSMDPAAMTDEQLDAAMALMERAQAGWASADAARSSSSSWRRRPRASLELDLRMRPHARQHHRPQAYPGAAPNGPRRFEPGAVIRSVPGEWRAAPARQGGARGLGAPAAMRSIRSPRRRSAVHETQVQAVHNRRLFRPPWRPAPCAAHAFSHSCGPRRCGCG